MPWSDDIRIETPEQIDVALELAGLGSRFVAKLYDWVVKAAVLVVAALAAVLLLAVAGDLIPTPAQMGLLIFLIALFYAFLFGYDIYYEVRHNGQTPGKKQAGVRVLREGGAPVDFRSSCVRNLLAIADFLPSFYLLGALLVLLTGRSQRLGDLAAGTIVIRERVAAPPDDVLKQAEPIASPEIAFTAGQLAACTPHDRYVLRSYFQRGPGLLPDARERLAVNLATEFLRKTEYPLDGVVLDGARAESFLASLYRDLERLGPGTR